MNRQEQAWWAARDAVLTATADPGAALAAANAVEQLVAGLMPRPVDRRPWVAWAVERLGPRDLPPAQLARRMRQVADDLERAASDRAHGRAA